MLASIRSQYPWLRHVFADGGYAGDKLRNAMAGLGQWSFEIIKRSETVKGFELLPRRWVVERTFAWLGRCRRLAKDFEATIQSAVAWIPVAHAVADKATVQRLVIENVHPASRLHTDESRLYVGAADLFASHETVKHSANECARGDVNTNSAEGFFGVFKKGMKGVYQQCGEKHLNRYVTEFGFRHNTRAAHGYNDGERTDLAIIGTIGKRLTYRQPHQAYV